MAAEEGDAGAINKASIRQKIWDHIEDNDLAEFPRPVYRRIPNVKDAAAAAEQLKDLDAFKNSKTVKVNPDKPQENARFLVLEAEKTLLVPTPRMKEGLFHRIVVPPESDKSEIRNCCNSRGMKENGVSVGTADKYLVDLVIIGSVAVSKTGIRIGKGEGFADLEFAIMAAAGAVDSNVIVVTTVDDCQVVDIPEALIEKHDVPIDFIVTPTQIIECSPGRPKPSGIFWNILTPRKFNSIPILKELKEEADRNGIDTTLAPEDEDDEEYEQRVKNQNRRNVRRGVGRPPRGTRYRNTDSGGDRNNDGGQRRNKRRRRDCPPGCRIFVGTIAARTPVSKFKAAIREQGVYPTRVVWRGERRFCFLWFEVKDKIDDDIETLKGITFNDIALSPALALERDEMEPKGDNEMNGSLSPSDEDEDRRPRKDQRQRNNRRRYQPRRRGNQGNTRRRDDIGDGDRSKDEDRDPERPPRRRRRREHPPGCRIFVGGIARRVTVSKFKEEVRGQGVTPKRVDWRGSRGYCFLEFEVPDRIETDIETLSKISFNNLTLRPEVAKEFDEMERRDKDREVSQSED